MKNLDNRVGIIGGGSWGSALAVLLASKGIKTNIWLRSKEQVDKITRDKENMKYLPGILLDNNISEIGRASCRERV